VDQHDKITFTPIGGGKEIGANSYLVSVYGHDILLDCGIHPKKEGRASLPDLALLSRAPIAAVVSHAHVDHCGALPQLIKRYSDVPIFLTEATRSIMERMLHNSVSVMTAMARERGIPDYPLYMHEDVDVCMAQTEGFEFDREFDISGDGGITVQFHHAGHVLGSASIVLRLPGHNILYTGDICTTDQELMAGSSPYDDYDDIDTLVIESTYGANEEADDLSYEAQTEQLASAISQVLNREGVALLPAFALGRTQEILNLIARLQDSGDIPSVPVYASGLGRAVYEVYSRYSEYLHPAANLRPLNRFGRIGDVWDRSVAMDLLKEPCIVVATSGMMVENTPSALIAEQMVRANGKRKEHGIFFVGYVDPDTLGYKLLHSGPGTALSFAIGRAPVPVSLENVRHFHFSAHAPRKALRNVIEHVNPRNVVFVHGDSNAVDSLYSETSNAFHKYAPMMGETLTLS